MDGRREIIERLGAAGIPCYVTGSEAMAVIGLAHRATNDIDLVLDLDPPGYDTRLRPAFEPDYLVSSLLHVGHRWTGSAINASGEVTKADFIIREPDAWGTEALARAVEIDDPALGRARVSTADDLLLAKLEFADGDLGGLQGRDIGRILDAVWPGLDEAYVRRHAAGLDEAYVRRHAAGLGVTALLEEALRDAGA